MFAVVLGVVALGGMLEVAPMLMLIYQSCGVDPGGLRSRIYLHATYGDRSTQHLVSNFCNLPQVQLVRLEGPAAVTDMDMLANRLSQSPASTS